MRKIKHALISVSDKTGIVEFAGRLVAHGVTILSTGGTAKHLTEYGILVTEVAEYTGSSEIMDGRVKTLHPKIHGGLLGRPGRDDRIMAASGITPIDLLVVNLYPFEATVSRPDCTLVEALENIDIGGPAMLRSAAKNYAFVAVVVDTGDYKRVLNELDDHRGELSSATRFRLAQKAFAYTSHYDANISNYLGAMTVKGTYLDYPLNFSSQFSKLYDLRYGENPHQKAAFYSQPAPPTGTLAAARQRQGKQLSYNNIADADAALECVLAYQEPACVIVKHTNPCGVALGQDSTEAYRLAYQTDSDSAFGGVIALNRPLEASTAQAIVAQQFAEVIIAPQITDSALAVTAAKENLRVLEVGERKYPLKQVNMKRVSGGLLVQDNDQGMVSKNVLNVVSQRTPTDCELEDLLFAWKVAKYVKSNAIVYAKAQRTIGIGAGQMSRVFSHRIAAIKAAGEDQVAGDVVMASDAFFPFRDSIDAAAKAGVKAVIQPGGSVRDREVIAAADEHNIAMLFTGMRHFLH